MSDATAAPPAGAGADDHPQQLERFGVLRVGGVRLGVEGRHCSGLIEISRPTPLPWSQDFVLGVLYLRGAIVPLLDAGRLLGIERSGPYATGLVISSGAGTGVLAADEMVTFEPYDLRGVTPVNGSVSPRLKSFSQGVLIVDGTPVVWLDTPSLLTVVRDQRTGPKSLIEPRNR